MAAAADARSTERRRRATSSPRCSTAPTSTRRGSRRRPSTRGRSRASPQLKRALVEVVRGSRPRRADRAGARPPRAGRQGDGRQSLTAESTQRAGPGRPDRLHAGRIRDDPAAQRRLQREVRLAVHARGARPARRRPEPRGRSSRPSSAGSPNHPDFELAECLRNIHRIAELRLDDKLRRDAGARQPGLGLGRAAGAPHRPGLRRARPAHGHLPDRRAPRLRRAAGRAGCATSAASTRCRSMRSATSSASIAAPIREREARC